MDLGTERCFLDLITGEIAPELRQRLLRYAPSSALDIGCGIGTTLVCLHYALGIDHLEGLDRQTESEVLNDYNKNARAQGKQEFSSVEDCWLAVTTDQTDVRPRVTGREQFSDLLNISFGSFIGTYICKRDRYDLIVLSHVLHYLDARIIEQSFYQIRRHSHSQTLIYMSIKDGFEGSKLSSEELLALCRAFASEKDLKEYGPRATDQGMAYTFTNI